MNEKIIDIEGLEQIAAGDESFVIEILTLYSERTTKDVLELKEAEAKKDWKTVQFLVHRMRSAAVPLGIKDLLVFLKKVELNIKKGDVIDIESLLSTVYKLSKIAIDEAKSELDAKSV